MQKLTPLIIYLQNDGQFSYFILKTSLHEKVSHAKFLAKIYNFDFCSTRCPRTPPELFDSPFELSCTKKKKILVAMLEEKCNYVYNGKSILIVLLTQYKKII